MNCSEPTTNVAHQIGRDVARLETKLGHRWPNGKSSPGSRKLDGFQSYVLERLGRGIDLTQQLSPRRCEKSTPLATEEMEPKQRKSASPKGNASTAFPPTSKRLVSCSHCSSKRVRSPRGSWAHARPVQALEKPSRDRLLCCVPDVTIRPPAGGRTIDAHLVFSGEPLCDGLVDGCSCSSVRAGCCARSNFPPPGSGGPWRNNGVVVRAAGRTRRPGSYRHRSKTRPYTRCCSVRSSYFSPRWHWRSYQPVLHDMLRGKRPEHDGRRSHLSRARRRSKPPRSVPAAEMRVIAIRADLPMSSPGRSLRLRIGNS